MERKGIRKVKGFKTTDGAGVKLVRVLGNETIKDFDPILMLDSFDSNDPKDYTAGFPFHPHRGIETITYLVKGSIEHRDSLGFSDTIHDEEVQWMCAGSGIYHEEAIPASERMLGVQIWLNLPQKDKMCEPTYHAIHKEDIREIQLENNCRLRLIAGSYQEYKGYAPQHNPLDFYEVVMGEKAEVTLASDLQKSAMIFTLLGEVEIGNEIIPEKTAVSLGEGDSLTVRSLQKEARVLILQGKALQEDVAWGGPIVMNTKEELYQAFEELQTGTFLKQKTQTN